MTTAPLATPPRLAPYLADIRHWEIPEAILDAIVAAYRLAERADPNLDPEVWLAERLLDGAIAQLELSLRTRRSRYRHAIDKGYPTTPWQP
jgi:hypothetical protein